MDTRKLEEGSKLIASTSWAAIASGVFVALALQIVLLLFGLAVGLSVGDKTVGGGYALWAVIVQLFAIAVGAALAARIAHAGHTSGGIVAGIMTWAVSLVLGGALQGFTMVQRFDSTGGAWAAFLGVTLGLGAAIVGGAIGASRWRGRHTTEPPAPVVTSPV